MCSRKRGARQYSRQHNNLHSIPKNRIFRPRKNQVKQSKVFWFWNQKRIWMCFLFLWRTVIECEGSRQYIGQRQTHQKNISRGVAILVPVRPSQTNISLYVDQCHTPRKICDKFWWILLFWSLPEFAKKYFIYISYIGHWQTPWKHISRVLLGFALESLTSFIKWVIWLD